MRLGIISGHSEMGAIFLTLGTGSLSADGHAAFSTSSVSKGTHSITATYGGNDNYDGCSSSAVSQVIK